jgi:hypothetical protein
VPYLTMEKPSLTSKRPLRPRTGGARRFPSEMAVTTPLHHPSLSGHFVWSHLMSTLAPTAGVATNTAACCRMQSGRSHPSESELFDEASNSSSSEASGCLPSCPGPEDFVGASPARRPLRAARPPPFFPTVAVSWGSPPTSPRPLAPAQLLRAFAVRAVAANGSNLMVSEAASESSTSSELSEPLRARFLGARPRVLREQPRFDAIPPSCCS